MDEKQYYGKEKGLRNNGRFIVSAEYICDHHEINNKRGHRVEKGPHKTLLNESMSTKIDRQKSKRDSVCE